MRQADLSEPGWAIWLTGLPASGKTTIGLKLQHLLRQSGVNSFLMDSDAMRAILTPAPTYSEQERDDFYARLTQVASLLVDQGVNVIIAATGNRRAYRDSARDQLSRFFEVWVQCPLHVCQQRDPKGLYVRAAAGDLPTMPGVNAAYEEPEMPDLVVDSERIAAEKCAQIIASSAPFFANT